MTRSGRTSFALLFSSTSIVLLQWYIAVGQAYPFYFAWDMDWVVALDNLLMHSGLLPDHVCHTGFGMNLILFVSAKIGHALGCLSVLSIDSLATALNPVVALAESTAYFRAHTPFAILLCIMLLGLAIKVGLRLSAWWLLLAVALLGSQESLIYHASMIRTELYSVLYWACAVLAIACAVHAGTPRRATAFLLAAGVFLGLSFQTKIQSLLYVIGAIGLFAVLRDLHRTEGGDVSEQTCGADAGCDELAADTDSTQAGNAGHEAVSPGRASMRCPPVPVLISLFNVSAFVLLTVLSHRSEVPAGVSTWARGFGVTPLCMLTLAAFAGLLVFQVALHLKGRSDTRAFADCCALSMIGAGLILSLGLHLVVYSDPSKGWRYLLVDFKMMFLRDTHLVEVSSVSFHASNLLSYVRYHPALFATFLALNLLVVAGKARDMLDIGWRHVAGLLLMSLLVLANVAIGTRFILRDLLWVEVFMNVVNLICLAVLSTRSGTRRRLLCWPAFGAVGVLFLANLAHARSMPDRIDANYNHYGWQSAWWFGRVYRGNQSKYAEIIAGKYTKETALFAKSVAADHKQLRRDVDYVFKNQEIDHRHIGVVFAGFPVWADAQSYRITELAPELRGAILVDSASLPIEEHALFRHDTIREHSEHLDKLAEPGQWSLKLSVLNRSDLDVFLFADAANFENPELTGESTLHTEYDITVSNPESTLQLRGLEIRNYAEIPVDKIRGRYFLVVARRP